MTLKQEKYSWLRRPIRVGFLEEVTLQGWKH